jgi:hypothetical protein
LPFWYLKYLDPLFSELLREYDGDTVRTNDLLTAVKARPDVFQLLARQSWRPGTTGREISFKDLNDGERS